MSGYRGAYVGTYVCAANLKFITVMFTVLVLPTLLQKYNHKSNLIIFPQQQNHLVRLRFLF